MVLAKELTRLLYSGLPEDEVVRRATLLIRSVLVDRREEAVGKSGVDAAFFDQNDPVSPENAARGSVPVPGVTHPGAFLAGKKLGEVMSQALRGRIEPSRCEALIDEILAGSTR